MYFFQRSVFLCKVVIMLADILLEIIKLKTKFKTHHGAVKAADGIDLTVHKKEILGILGESGCGKSVTALSIMRLIPSPPGEIHADKMEFNGVELQSLTEKQMSKVRGNDISMIFQEPLSALNPAFTIGEQLIEVLMLHQKLDRNAAYHRAIEALNLVQIPSATKRLADYPHQFSGGMRQRVMLAMACACAPSLLIADEPTTALDVTVQAQILELLRQLQSEMNMAIMLITHDLGLVAEIAQRVVVMYAGVVVENATVLNLFVRPLHPYTQGLLASLPLLEAERERLNVIPGGVPNMLNLPSGCRFHPRCPHCWQICRQQEPPLFPQNGSEVRCWLFARETNK
ncbi:MAG: Oligopeptide transport ATP-binding protein OppD [Dehalococcoidia bacterium]|nr:Oligopeptide transport ATP-binding protein OppD [Bacillota bacterium]